MKKSRKLLLGFIFIFNIFIFISVNPQAVGAFSAQVIQKGATGDDVVELQARLQNIGFYTGKIDGKFGWSTYWALRNFQSDFGLPIDGLAGKSTKNKLVKASHFNKQWVHEQINQGNTFTYYAGVPIEKQVKKNTSTAQKNTSKNNNATTNKNNTTSQNTNKTTTTKITNIPAGYTENDINLLAQAVYGEARGEPYVGQVAVAAVILNRLESPSFPNSVYGVLFEPLAFTAVADGQIWLEPNETAKKAVLDAINGYDPSGNAMYYFNPETATSKWIWSRPQIKQIGKHIFCE